MSENCFENKMVAIILHLMLKEFDSCIILVLARKAGLIYII